MISKKTFMEIAYSIANESKARRRKVGSVIVKDNNIIAVGYNGTPSGFDNNCENEVPIKKIDPVNFFNKPKIDLSKVDFDFIEENSMPKGVIEFEEESSVLELITKPEVLHAESNAIAKCARSTSSSEGAEIYTTTSPCFDCSKLIIQAGIKAVYYSEEYKDTKGLELLRKADIKVERIEAAKSKKFEDLGEYKKSADKFSGIMQQHRKATKEEMDNYFNARNEGLLKHMENNQGL